MHVRFRWVRTTSLMRTSTTAACCMSVHLAQVRLLSVLSVVPAFSILNLSVLALYLNHYQIMMAVQSRLYNQGHTIKAAQSRPLLKLHTQGHTLKHQCRLLKIARSGDKTARSRLLVQPRRALA